MTADVDRYPLEKRRILKKTIASTLKCSAVLVIILIIDIILQKKFNLNYTQMWYYWAALGAIFIIKFLYNILAYNRFYYDMQERYIVLREGVVARKERTLPYNRIHDLYVDQDILDRIFRLWDLHMTTIEPRSKKIHIDGLNGKNARFIRDTLLKKI